MTKNDLLDKSGEMDTVFKKFLGHSFLLSKGDAMWKAKRKACAHAFYKDRLDKMME